MLLVSGRVYFLFVQWIHSHKTEVKRRNYHIVNGQIGNSNTLIGLVIWLYYVCPGCFTSRARWRVSKWSAPNQSHVPWPCFPTIKKKRGSGLVWWSLGTFLTPNCCSNNFFCSPWNQQGLLQVPLKGHLVKCLKMMEFPASSFDASWGPYGKPCLTGGCTELRSWSWTPWKKGAWKTILFSWNGPTVPFPGLSETSGVHWMSSLDLRCSFCATSS